MPEFDDDRAPDGGELGIGAVPDGFPRGWRIWLRDGVAGRLRPVAPAQLVAEQPAIGLRVAYGLGGPPEAFDRFVLRERGGGGVVIAPYALDGGEVYVGTIRQHRALQGRSEPALPMGGVAPGEERLAAARREFAEETGLGPDTAAWIVPLPGRPFNPSPGFFRTDRRAGEGATFYAVRLPLECLAPRRQSADPARRVYDLPPDAGAVVAVRDAGEAIHPSGLRFFHAPLLLRCAGDGFTLAGVARLLGALAASAGEARR